MAITAPDYEVQLEATAVKVRFNTASTLHLYKNNPTIDESVTIATFTEANYAGYADVPLTGDWSAPAQQAPGDYYVSSPAVTFAAPTSGTQTIYGWWVDDGTGVLACEAFASPITLASGSPGFSLQVNYEVIAKILV